MQHCKGSGNAKKKPLRGPFKALRGFCVVVTPRGFEPRLPDRKSGLLVSYMIISQLLTDVEKTLHGIVRGISLETE